MSPNLGMRFSFSKRTFYRVIGRILGVSLDRSVLWGKCDLEGLTPSTPDRDFYAALGGFCRFGFVSASVFFALSEGNQKFRSGCAESNAGAAFPLRPQVRRTRSLRKIAAAFSWTKAPSQLGNVLPLPLSKQGRVQGVLEKLWLTPQSRTPSFHQAS